MTGTQLPTVWQVSGGPRDRPYADVFLDHGVALIASGDDVAWRSPRYRGGQGVLSRFALELQIGDLLLLRISIDAVAAVGIVAADYERLEAFEDVNGWDLQHARRVRWYRLPESYHFESRIFGATPARFSRVQSPEGMEYARSFLTSGLSHWKEAPLPALPPVDPPLVEVPEDLRDVVGLALDLAGLYRGDGALGDAPNENEMVAHFVVPFLRGLGWPPENIAVEWRRIDIALFDTLPRTPESCRFVIEAKRLGTGLEEARKQAERYISKLGVRRDVVVTDGFRYRAYDCDRNFTPVAYANLAHLKEPSLALFERLRRSKE